MGQPATAGVVVGVIFILLIGSVVGYKLFRKWQWRRHLKRQEQELPPISDVARSTTPSQYPLRSNSPGPSMIGSLYGDAYPRDSFGRASMSKNSFSSIRTPITLPYQGSSASEYAVNRPRRMSSQGLMTAFPSIAGGEDPSLPGSPISQTGIASPDEAYDGPSHIRALSSASSTMTLRRSYAGSTFRSMSGSVSPGPQAYKRDSYLPHLPENRDAIQIVPPQPLGFSFGMAQALDQRTLGFSSTSGIGAFETVFDSEGNLWDAQEKAAQEEAARQEELVTEEALRDHIKRGGSIGEEQRQRYLAQGPSRSVTPAMLRGAIHNHLYQTSQQGSSGAQTPEGGSSRPRSPAQEGWGGSSSDIGPSVSQRGGPSHPLEHSNAQPMEATGSRQSQKSTNAAAFESVHSPLGLMSVGRNPDDSVDISTNTISDSPILQAFQNPTQLHRQAAATAMANSGVTTPIHTPHDSVNSTRGPATPGLVSNDSHSQSSKNTDPVQEIHHTSADQYRTGESDVTHRQERRVELGKDGQLHVWNSADEGATTTTSAAQPTPQNEKRSSKAGGWFNNRFRRSSSGAMSPV